MVRSGKSERDNNNKPLHAYVIPLWNNNKDKLQMFLFWFVQVEFDLGEEEECPTLANVRGHVPPRILLAEGGYVYLSQE